MNLSEEFTVSIIGTDCFITLLIAVFILDKPSSILLTFRLRLLGNLNYLSERIWSKSSQLVLEKLYLSLGRSISNSETESIAILNLIAFWSLLIGVVIRLFFMRLVNWIRQSAKRRSRNAFVYGNEGYSDPHKFILNLVSLLLSQ